MQSTIPNSACDLLLERTYEEIWFRGQKYADSNRVEIVTSIETYTIAPPAISGREIDEMFDQPLKADLEKLRILADETALGGRPRPHSRLPNMPPFNTNLNKPLTIPEIKTAFAEIASWSRRRSYDSYFCSGEMVAAFCEVSRLIKKRLTVTEPVTTAEILLLAQKFHYRLIVELIDDSNGLHEFTETHLNDIYQSIRSTNLKNDEKNQVDKLLAGFDKHRNDY